MGVVLQSKEALELVEASKIMIMLVMYLNCAFEIFLLFDFLKGLFPIQEDRRGIRFLKTLICIEKTELFDKGRNEMS